PRARARQHVPRTPTARRAVADHPEILRRPDHAPFLEPDAACEAERVCDARPAKVAVRVFVVRDRLPRERPQPLGRVRVPAGADDVDAPGVIGRASGLPSATHPPAPLYSILI